MRPDVLVDRLSVSILRSAQGEGCSLAQPAGFRALLAGHTPAFAAMRWTACSPGLSSRSRPTRTRPATSTGSSRSTPPSSPPPARCRHRTKRGINRPDEPDDHALGRSRGGLTTKIHLACDGKGRPLAILLTPGQRHDSICARPLLERIRVRAPARAGLAASQTRSSPTRPTAPEGSAPTCANAASPAPSRREPTSSDTGTTAAVTAGGHRPSTVTFIGVAT